MRIANSTSSRRQRSPHQPLAAGDVVALRRFALRVPALHEHPLAVDVVRDERSEAVGIAHPVEDAGAIAYHGAQIGLEMNHDEALQVLGADLGNVEPLANAAARAVRRQHVAAAYLVGRIALQVAHLRGDAVGVALSGLPLVAVAGGGGARRGERVEEDRLETMLGEVAQRGRRKRQHVVSLALVRQSAEHLSAQLAHPVDEAGVGGILGRRLDRLHVDACLAKDLERAGVDGVRGGSALRAGAALDDATRDAEPMQQQSRRQPDRARRRRSERVCRFASSLCLRLVRCGSDPGTCRRRAAGSVRRYSPPERCTDRRMRRPPRRAARVVWRRSSRGSPRTTPPPSGCSAPRSAAP